MHLHYFPLRSWFQFLLTDYSHLLLGGIPRGDPRSKLLTKSFWEMYRVAHSDHWVFHGAQWWAGKVYSILFTSRWRNQPSKNSDPNFSTFRLHGAWTQLLHLKRYVLVGLVWMRLWLITCCKRNVTTNVGHLWSPDFCIQLSPKDGTPKNTVFAYNKVLGQNCHWKSQAGLWRNRRGVSHLPWSQGGCTSTSQGRTLQPLFPESWNKIRMDKFLNCLSKFVTSKLGKPFHVSGKQQPFEELVWEEGEKAFCPQCLAGLDDVPYEDFSWSPLWKPTVGLTHPWPVDDPSPLLQIPGLGVNQQDLFRKDPFHIFKQTVGGHWVASTIVLLLDLGYWSRPGQSNQADTLLEFAYEDFNHFVKKEWTGHNVANIKPLHQSIAPLAKG